MVVDVNIALVNNDNHLFLILLVKKKKIKKSYLWVIKKRSVCL